ncbi:retrovirus-related pol polyprotein from transposon TNT 1-94 [Tanacetum coccineum]
MKQFVIYEDESNKKLLLIDLNTIITSLKALESKDLTSLSIDELHWKHQSILVIIKKRFRNSKANVEEKISCIKAKKEYSDEDVCDLPIVKQEYAMANVQNHRKTRTKEPLLRFLERCGDEDDENVKEESCLVVLKQVLYINTKITLLVRDPKSTEGVFLGDITLVDDDLDEEEAIREIEKKNLENNVEDETLEINEVVNIKESRNHPLENVIGNLNQRTLRSQAQNQSNFYCLISTIEPKNVNEVLGDESWIVVMQEELNQFIANDVWELVPQPKNMTVIGTKWMFRNKLDENMVSQNKARLVAQGYNQQEGIDYDETYASVARLE